MSIQPEVRRRVYERDGNKCVACGHDQQLTIDHRIPRCRGGTDAEKNLQTMCKPCNEAKGSKMPGEPFRKNQPVAVQSVRLSDLSPRLVSAWGLRS